MSDDQIREMYLSFNTQPPEGGWSVTPFNDSIPLSFNTQPPEGGWVSLCRVDNAHVVSTHSRLKAAGADVDIVLKSLRVSTHSRLKAAGQTPAEQDKIIKVSTHSRLKAAGS